MAEGSGKLSTEEQAVDYCKTDSKNETKDKRGYIGPGRPQYLQLLGFRQVMFMRPVVYTRDPLIA